jgi:hypothetical protein
MVWLRHIPQLLRRLAQIKGSYSKDSPPSTISESCPELLSLRIQLPDRTDEEDAVYQLLQMLTPLAISYLSMKSQCLLMENRICWSSALVGNDDR